MRVEAARVTRDDDETRPLARRAEDRDQTGPVGPGDRDAWSNPLPGWDRYDITGILGEGGMGRVYQAVDRTLGRLVALKFLRSDDARVILRFQEEAQAQASVEHPAVCRVYEVGEVEGRPFIAMQLIRGRSLKECGDELTRDQKVHVLAQVARALHAAHALGVIHRDVKPANIMVEAGEAGLQPYILDFGIACQVENPGVTVTGTLLGTPAFMAPEQVRSGRGRIDRRVDVYGLGATLYALLSGQEPFRGSTRMATLLEVLDKEPEPLRSHDPQIPKDLETIVARCLEKEPQKRYASARDLADDLERYLAGDPIEARPVGPIGRALRVARKHLVLTSVVTVATVVVLTLLGVVVVTRVDAGRRQALAQSFGQELERIDSLVRTAHLLPLHDVTPQVTAVRRRMAAIAAASAARGDGAAGPGRHALGRGHLALGELEAARQQLQAAWDGGYRTPETEASLGEVLAELYLDRRERGERRRDPELRAAELAELRTSLLEPAVRHLAASRDAAGSDYRAALLALVQDDHAAARELAARAAAAEPWRYEALVLAAEVAKSRAATLLDTGEEAAARDELAAAGRTLAEALAIGRSDPAVYLAEAARLARLVDLAVLHGELPAELVEAAETACRAALVADPRLTAAVSLEAGLATAAAEFETGRGGDPVAALARAVTLAERAAALDPSDVEVALRLADIHRSRAAAATQSGVDARPYLTAALAAIARALALDPDSAAAHSARGATFYALAERDLAAGADPSEALASALAGYRASLEVRPSFAAWSNSGLVHWQEAAYAARHGRDARPALAAASACFERAIEANPKHGHVRNNHGLVLLQLADEAIAANGDPLPLVDRAAAAVAEAVALLPRLTEGYNNLGNAAAKRAEVEVEAGGDPRASLARADASFAKAIELNPQLTYLYNNRGDAQTLAARYELAQGRDPRPALVRARDTLGEAVERDPSFAFAWHNLGVTWRTEAEYLSASGGDPRPALEQGRKAVGRAIATNPDHYRLPFLLAQLEWLEADWARRSGRPAAPAAARARAALARAEALNPDSELVRELAAEMAERPR